MEEAKKIRNLVEPYFENGLLCAEIVVAALAEFHGVDIRLVSKPFVEA